LAVIIFWLLPEHQLISYHIEQGASSGNALFFFSKESVLFAGRIGEIMTKIILGKKFLERVSAQQSCLF
jgi:hypothetical protein